MRALAIAAVALCACNASADVVARPIDAGAGPAHGLGDAASDATAASTDSCGATPSALAMLTKGGELDLFDLVTKMVTAVPAGSCGDASGGALAVDRSGNALVVTAAGKAFSSRTATGQCTPLGTPPAVPVAMAFVWDPGAGRESLYAIVDGKLVVVDTATLAFTTVGVLDPPLDQVRGLAGTVDGWLLAFAGDPLVTIAYVDTKAAVVKTSAQLKSPDPVSRFAGGMPNGTGYELVFGASAFSFDAISGTVALHGPLFANDPAIIAVSASPCAVLGK